MNTLLGFTLGVIIASVGWYLVAKNNKDRFTDLLDLDPEAKWKEILTKIKDKL